MTENVTLFYDALSKFLNHYIFCLENCTRIQCSMFLVVLFLSTVFFMWGFIFLLNIYDVFYKSITIENKTFVCKHVVFILGLWVYTLFLVAFLKQAPFMLSFILWPLLYLYMFLLYKYRPGDFLFFYFKVEGQLPLILFFVLSIFFGCVAVWDYTTIKLHYTKVMASIQTMPFLFVTSVTDCNYYGLTGEGEMYGDKQKYPIGVNGKVGPNITLEKVPEQGIHTKEGIQEYGQKPLVEDKSRDITISSPKQDNLSSTFTEKGITAKFFGWVKDSVTGAAVENIAKESVTELAKASSSKAETSISMDNISGKKE